MMLRVVLAALGIGLSTTTWAAPSRAEGASLHEATKEQSLAAQKAFKAADVRYDAKQFAEALAGYRASYDVVKSPNARLMIARSLRELGLLGEAYAEAKATLAEAEAVSPQNPRYAETAQAARDDLKALATRVGFVKLDVDETGAEGLVARIGDRSFPSIALDEPIAVTPGETTIVVTAAGDKKFRRKVTVESGGTQTVSVDFDAGSRDSANARAPKLAESSVGVGSDTSMRTWAYVAGGAGAAGLLTFGVFGLLTSSSYSSLEDDCPNGRCPPGRNDDIDAGRRYQLIANAGLGVGIVGLAAATTLFVLSAKAPEQTQTAVRITPGTVAIERRF
jgi:hypothetical protein